MNKKNLSIAVILLCLLTCFKSEAQNSFLDKTDIGFRFGWNYADMKYSNEMFNIYKHQPNWKTGYGFFITSHVTPHFAIRPEVDIMGRGTSLRYEDIRYNLNVKYVDVRLPLIISIAPRALVNPYLFIAPEFCMAWKGTITYKSDFFGKDSTPISKGNIRPFDVAVLGGLGIEIPIRIGNFRFSIAGEAGYNFGFLDTFSEDELEGDADVINWYEPDTYTPESSRFNRGIEAALTFSLPLGNFHRSSKSKEPRYEEPIVEPTHQTEILEYEIKDCYTFEELYSLVKQGVDVSNKRICVFDMKFQFGSAKLMRSSEEYLDNVVGMMKAYPGMKIQINGHTDNVGTAEFNQTLSEQRAQAVANYLTKHGIDASRMSCSGFGLRYPIDTNDTEEGRARNRRVEIEVTRTK